MKKIILLLLTCSQFAWAGVQPVEGLAYPERFSLPNEAAGFEYMSGEVLDIKIGETVCAPTKNGEEICRLSKLIEITVSFVTGCHSKLMPLAVIQGENYKGRLQMIVMAPFIYSSAEASFCAPDRMISKQKIRWYGPTNVKSVYIDFLQPYERVSRLIN